MSKSVNAGKLGALVAAGCIGLMTLPCASGAEIHQAVRHNDTKTLRELLTSQLPADVNERTGQGVTALHLAAVMNNAPVVRLLLEHGAQVDAATDGGFTPLHWAASRNAIGCLQPLLEAGANPNATTGSGITPLHWAASRNAADATRLLIAVGANVEAQTTEGMTPLHWAVRQKASQDAAHIIAEVIVARQMAAEATNPPPALVSAAAPPKPGPEPAITKNDRLPPIYVTPQTASTPRILVVDIGLGESLRLVWIDSLRLWVGQYEISNAQFRRFRSTHDSGMREAFSLNDPRQPAVQVSWEDASAFCQWLNESHRDKIPPRFRFRLPTAEEWMATARCGDDRTYPWGNTWPPTSGNYGDLTARESLTEWNGIEGYDDGFAVTAPVEQCEANTWGIHGLAGNVWEWCADWYSEERLYKVRCGGSWFFDQEPNMRIRAIGFDRPDLTDDTIGFRVVLRQDG